MRRQTILPDEKLRKGLSEATIDIIESTVIELSGLKPGIVKSRTRRLDVLQVRHLITYFMSVNNNRSFAEISLHFKKDHATAINSCRAIENWIATDHSFKFRVIQIAAEIIRRNTMPGIQLVGKITGVEYDRALRKFKETQNKFELDGWKVWNPMEQVPVKMERGEQMRICLRNLVDPRTMAVAVQPDWVSSEGSKVEYMVAKSLNLQVIML